MQYLFTGLIIILFFLSIPLISQDDYNLSSFKSFVYRNKISLLNNTIISPGQFSKTGNKFYLPVKSKSGDSKQILTYKIADDGNYKLLSKSSFQIDKKGIFSAGQISLTQNENYMALVCNNYDSWYNNDLYLAERKENTFKMVRKITEVNKQGATDSYPFISSDGLRIYFSQGRHIAYSERPTLDAPFSKVTHLNTGPTHHIVSCWLTKDEKELYFIEGNVVYRMSRPSKSEPFSLPVVFINGLKKLNVVTGFSMNESQTVFAFYYQGTIGNEEYFKSILSDEEKKKDLNSQFHKHILIFTRYVM